MGLVKLTQGSFSEYGKQENSYNIRFFDTDKDLINAFERGEVDIASLPLNRASKLYNKNKNKAVCIAANSVCTMKLIENGSDVKSPKDVKGKTVYLSGKGNMTDAVSEILLEMTGVDDDNVNVVYKDNETECVEALMKKKDSLALVSEPFASMALDENENIRVCLDLSQRQNMTNEDAFVTRVLVTNRNFLDANNDAVNLFLDDFRYSCTFSKEKGEETVKLALEKQAVPEDFDKKALEKCGNCCAVGEEMKTKVQSCLDIMYSYEDDLVGERLPNEDFYFLGVY